MRIYAATILCSSFLLFAIQPIVAKAILPWFGGSAAVWTTCMLFFQAALLAGYAYAHGLARLVPRRQQVLVHLALLGATLMLLPVGADPAWQPAGEENPSLRILGLLAVSVGLPYFLLSSTAPLIQSWARSGTAGTPYRLYALSNAGSLLALLGYPLGIEPLFTTSAQFHGWSAGYAVFAALSAAAALHARRAAGVAAPAGPSPAADQLVPDRMALWVALPALSSVLLLGVTNQLCQEIAVVPLLWLLPLTLYLLSFILCFESERWYRRRPYLAALVVLSGLALLGFVLTPYLGARVGVGLFSLYLFVACMACHGELVQLRPPASRLTLFYLMVSLGGVLGGAFVALVAPAIFPAYFELPLAIVLAVVVVRHAREHTTPGEWLRFGAFLLAVAIGTAWLDRTLDGTRDLRVAARNFYGALRVVESDATAGRVRTLSHGGTVHGMQYVDAARRREPLSYFVRESGVGQALERYRPDVPRRVAVLGLGAGTLAAFARPGDLFRFYEINPLVVELAYGEFSYLGDSAGRLEIVTADARLALERERGGPRFDVLVADVFSGDAIPVHLLTAEAFRVYAERLLPGGLLAVHISNHHLDLRPVVAAAVRALGWTAVEVDTPLGERSRGEANWVLASADPASLAALSLHGVQATGAGREILWRDDFSNLLQVLK